MVHRMMYPMMYAFWHLSLPEAPDLGIDQLGAEFLAGPGRPGRPEWPGPGRLAGGIPTFLAVGRHVHLADSGGHECRHGTLVPSDASPFSGQKPSPRQMRCAGITACHKSSRWELSLSMLDKMMSSSDLRTLL